MHALLLASSLVLALASLVTEEMARHRFLFVVGAHHSGTSLFASLLALHPDISAITNASVPENEGVHLQSIYKVSHNVFRVITHSSPHVRSLRSKSGENSTMPSRQSRT